MKLFYSYLLSAFILLGGAACKRQGQPSDSSAPPKSTVDNENFDPVERLEGFRENSLVHQIFSGDFNEARQNSAKFNELYRYMLMQLTAEVAHETFGDKQPGGTTEMTVTLHQQSNGETLEFPRTYFVSPKLKQFRSLLTINSLQAIGYQIAAKQLSSEYRESYEDIEKDLKILFTGKNNTKQYFENLERFLNERESYHEEFKPFGEIFRRYDVTNGSITMGNDEISANEIARDYSERARNTVIILQTDSGFGENLKELEWPWKHISHRLKKKYKSQRRYSIKNLSLGKDSEKNHQEFSKLTEGSDSEFTAIFFNGLEFDSKKKHRSSKGGLQSKIFAPLNGDSLFLKLGKDYTHRKVHIGKDDGLSAERLNDVLIFRGRSLVFFSNNDKDLDEYSSDKYYDASYSELVDFLDTHYLD